MAQTIKVVIVNGEVQMETKGFRGKKACHIATADLEKALGQTTGDMLTAEASLPESTAVARAQVKS